MTSTNSQFPQYLQQYGLKVAPFRLSPDPFFFFPSPTHLSAERILLHAIAGGEGFMVLTGKAGLGKTLLLRRILGSLDGHKIPILILSPAVDSIGLLQLLLGEMNIAYDTKDSLAVLLQIFQNQVLQMAQQKKELFIIVDEAQNMQVQTLEQLRMLSNLETGSRKLMQILLIGQSELETVLTQPGLGQLVQRIVVHERLEPLSRTQISQYVGYRLNKAGRGDIRLSKGACKALQLGSRGIPRLINRIMDRTLLLASTLQVSALSKKHVQAAISTMQDIRLAGRSRQATKISLAIGSTLVAAALLLSLFLHAPLVGTVTELAASSFTKIAQGDQTQ